VYKVENSKADTLFGGGLEGRISFWTLRPTKKLGTFSWKLKEKFPTFLLLAL